MVYHVLVSCLDCPFGETLICFTRSSPAWDKQHTARTQIIVYSDTTSTTLDTATNLSNSYSNDMLTVKLSGFPDMH